MQLKSTRHRLARQYPDVRGKKTEPLSLFGNLEPPSRPEASSGRLRNCSVGVSVFIVVVKAQQKLPRLVVVMQLPLLLGLLR